MISSASAINLQAAKEPLGKLLSEEDIYLQLERSHHSPEKRSRQGRSNDRLADHLHRGIEQKGNARQ
jgi:hypothetical protein